MLRVGHGASAFTYRPSLVRLPYPKMNMNTNLNLSVLPCLLLRPRLNEEGWVSVCCVQELLSDEESSTIGRCSCNMPPGNGRGGGAGHEHDLRGEERDNPTCTGV